MATPGAPRVNKISLRRAVAEVTSDDDVRKIARGLVDGAFDDDGKPRMDAINALIKLLPHVPSTAALERARILATANTEDQARLALDALLAHVIEDGTPEAATAWLDGLAKWTAAKKAAAETGAGSVGGTIVQIVPAGSSTSVSISNPPSEEPTR